MTLLKRMGGVRPQKRFFDRDEIDARGGQVEQGVPGTVRFAGETENLRYTVRISHRRPGTYVASFGGEGIYMMRMTGYVYLYVYVYVYRFTERGCYSQLGLVHTSSAHLWLRCATVSVCFPRHQGCFYRSNLPQLTSLETMRAIFLCRNDFRGERLFAAAHCCSTSPCWINSFAFPCRSHGVCSRPARQRRR